MNTELPSARSAKSTTLMGIVIALIKAIRPKQATKNLFVFAALLFAGKLFDGEKFLQETLAFVLFTAVAGSVYLLNDLLDVKQDRQHPDKCNRPIASGALPIPIAWIAFVILAPGAVIGSFLLDWQFGATVFAYLILQIAYCISLKHIVLVDAFVIAIGFVLRTVGGALAIHVTISHWLLLCSLQLALFLAFGKRRQELVLLGTGAGSHRAILQEYSLAFLDQLINLVVSVTIVCYSVYSVESDTAKLHPHLWLTVPFVIFGVCRYLYLVYQKGWGGAPDEVLMKDRQLQMTIVFWVVTVVLLLTLDNPLPMPRHI